MRRIEVKTIYEFKDLNTFFEEELNTYHFKIEVKVKCPTGIRNSKKTIKDLLKTSPEAREYFINLCMRALDRNIRHYDIHSWAYPEIVGNVLILHIRLRKGSTVVNSIEEVINNILQKKVNT